MLVVSCGARLAMVLLSSQISASPASLGSLGNLDSWGSLDSQGNLGSWGSLDSQGNLGTSLGAD